ncbi:unnamed protein product [Oikopleura dioica]|uniref:Uncharacterized protein n=1 Tax=Oikopleura dioica TaxID=34765 RepID=E4Y7S3_OIKDI|nr:unnamed protein product [Oikopleura dioica]
MLVETVKSETDDEQLYSKGDAELLSPSVELAYYTVCCSALNAEELNREKGLLELRRSLNRCMSTLSKSSGATDLDAKVCLFVCRTLTMSAQFPSCIASLTEEPASLLEDIIRLLCSHLVVLQLAAVEAVASFGMIPELRKSMISQGVLPILMEYLFEYDYTLEEAGIEKDMESNKQEQKNKLAKQALHAIIVLAGLTPNLETDADVRRCLDCCMTSYLVSLMEAGDLALMLKLFTTNSETPLLIWEGMARNELADFLEKERDTALKDASEVDLSRMANFKISAHSEELIVHGVFVRVFNEQPQFKLPDPEGYLKSLLDYLGNQAQYFASIGADGTVDPTRLKQTSMALHSVFHVLSANQAFSMQCVNSLRLLSSFFVNEHTTSEIQLNTLRIFGIVAVQEVVLAIAQQRLLSSILLVVERLTAQEHSFFLQVLSALSSHPEIVKQFIPTGGVLYTTNLFANSTEPAVRKEAASLLAKAISDRLSGPRVRISLSKLLPPIFADAMADNAEASVNLYEGIHENPELIWSEETRQETSLYLERSARDLSQQQAKNPEIDWKPPSESFLPNKEFILGGVYIRLLLLNPGWQLRRPKEFITTLFDRITDLTEPTNGQVDQNELDQLSEAGCGLFTTQIKLSKLVPGMGILPTLIKRLSETQYLRPILLLLNALCMESSCVGQIGEIENSLRALKRCLIDDQMAMIAFETIFRATSHSNANLTAQAMANDGEFVKALLEELSLNRVNKSAKAQIVKILKAFMECPEYGLQELSKQI